MISFFRERRKPGAALLLLLLTGLPCPAGLPEYDAAVTADAAAGLSPASRLTESATFLGTDSVAFNFGTVSGDGTFECVVEATGDVSSGYLAVGENSMSNLRLQQWPNTGQVGMTQSGLKDYFFTPPVSSPATPSHLAYVWDGAGTMRLYVNGVPAGTNSEVTPAFGLPTGEGRLGANPFNGEGMSGTVYRVTCYDSMLSDAVLLRHGEAFMGIRHVPVIQSFTASPAAVMAGSPVTLSWQVTGADSVTLDGADVTGLTEKSLTPTATATYSLRAVNANGPAEASVLVPVTMPVNHLLINEFMASNASTLADADGEFSDWLEIHNPTSSAVNLGGYFLTDKASLPRQWPLPAADLPAGGYRLVFLSGKNKITPGGEWHSNFKLGKEGEYLALTGPGGVVHGFAPSFPAQDDDTAYGLIGTDPQLAGYLGRPTPGAVNDSSLPKPARVTFSEAGGLLRAPVTVTLSCATAGSEIHYQLNKTAEAVYTAPLTVNATTRIRAWAVRLGQKGPESQITWVKLAASLTDYSSPLPIMIIDNFAAGPVPQKGWNGTGEGIKQVPRQSAAWLTWDRTGTAATTAGEPQFFTSAGIRGRGAYSSSWKQKPYSVEAMDGNGAEKDVAVLNMPAHSDWVFYFPDPGDSKDPTMLFNTFVYDLSRRLGHDAPRFRWVELFVNEDGGDISLTDRRGVYAVLEKVSRGPDRLDFQKLSADGTQGGWLLSLNRMDAIPETGWPAGNGVGTPQFFRTAGANRIKQTGPNNPVPGGDDEPQQSNGFLNFDNPGGYSITPAQRAAIEGWFKNFEDALYSNAVWKDPVNGYRKWLDDRDFAEYFIFNELTKNGDGLLISMYPWKGDDGRLRMGPTWDYNWSSYYIGSAPAQDLRWRSDRLWYARLFADPDFMQLYTDRWFAFRRSAMSNAGMSAIIDAQAAEITSAKAVAQGISSAANWQNRLTQMKTWLNTRANWVDSQYVTPPVLSVGGGIVPSGQVVGITAAAGTLYRTVDGGDPRASGGNVSVPAETGNSLTISGDTRLTVRARVSGVRWSAPTTAIYVTDAVPATAGNLVISEIHYHPADPSPAETAAGFTDSGDFEFIELLNTGTAKVSLSGLRFTAAAGGQGIGYVFDDGSRWSVPPGARVVMVKNAAAFALRYGAGIPVAGVFTGNLSNSGDTVTLVDGSGAVLKSLNYTDSQPWPAAADGSGRSLTLLGGALPAQASAAGSWRASVAAGGSPGTSDSLDLPAGGDLTAYAFGSFPTTWTWLNGAATASQRRVPGSDAVTVGMEYSSDLKLWIPAGEPETSGVFEADGSVAVKRTLPAGTHGFIRWRVTRRAS
ncbi:MAG: CotH kinase family protein [Verrucomicrobiota bacterium]